MYHILMLSYIYIYRILLRCAHVRMNSRASYSPSAISMLVSLRDVSLDLKDGTDHILSILVTSPSVYLSFIITWKLILRYVSL